MKLYGKLNPVQPEEREKIRELAKTHRHSDIAQITGRCRATIHLVLNGHKKKVEPDGFFSWKQYPNKNVII